MKKTEVFILSGFLGSGKTTLLKRLLTHEKEEGRKVAVLMNELGDISIDSNEVESDVPLKELLGGCVCCTIQDKLEGQLQSLLLEEKPDVIYLETTGAAHPVETMDSILSPIFADKLLLKGILTVMDGKLWLERSKMSPAVGQLLLEQVRHSSMILINKQDQLTEAEKSKVTFELQSINPKAFAILTSYSKLPIQRLKDMHIQFAKDTVKTTLQSLQLSSFVYQFKHTIASDKFEAFLKELPDTIYRIKGYVQFHQNHFPDLFQYSYGMPLMMREDMKMPLNLVFIGENMDWKQLKEKLDML